MKQEQYCSGHSNTKKAKKTRNSAYLCIYIGRTGEAGHENEGSIDADTFTAFT